MCGGVPSQLWCSRSWLPLSDSAGAPHYLDARLTNVFDLENLLTRSFHFLDARWTYVFDLDNSSSSELPYSSSWTLLILMNLPVLAV